MDMEKRQRLSIGCCGGAFAGCYTMQTLIATVSALFQFVIFSHQLLTGFNVCLFLR